MSPRYRLRIGSGEISQNVSDGFILYGEFSRRLTFENFDEVTLSNSFNITNLAVS